MKIKQIGFLAIVASTKILALNVTAIAQQSCVGNSPLVSCVDIASGTQYTIQIIGNRYYFRGINPLNGYQFESVFDHQEYLNLQKNKMGLPNLRKYKEDIISPSRPLTSSDDFGAHFNQLHQDSINNTRCALGLC